MLEKAKPAGTDGLDQAEHDIASMPDKVAIERLALKWNLTDEVARRLYGVSLSSTAAKYLSRCDVPTRGRLQQKLEKLKADPFDLRNSRPLKGRNDQRSARVGDLRILFRVQDLDIIVAEIGPRGDIHKRG